VVDKETELQAEGSGIQIPAGARDFSFLSNAQVSSVAQPASLIKWYKNIFTKVKQPGHAVDHSPPSGAKVKNEWSYTSTPIRLHSVDRVNCTFTLPKQPFKHITLSIP
jgi:hypothetical protein